MNNIFIATPCIHYHTLHVHSNIYIIILFIKWDKTNVNMSKDRKWQINNVQICSSFFISVIVIKLNRMNKAFVRDVKFYCRSVIIQSAKQNTALIFIYNSFASFTFNIPYDLHIHSVVYLLCFWWLCIYDDTRSKF